MEKEVICLKKEKFTTKDNRVLYRLHLWVDDGIVDYCTPYVDEEIFELVEPCSNFRISYSLNVFNSKVYGIKNIKLI